MDEGLPIAYQVLEEGIAVHASDGEVIGTVDHVVAAPEKDIFHGIVIRTGHERRFVAADQVESLHERGVDLRIDAAAATELPHPHGASALWRDAEPGVKPNRWKHYLDLLTGSDRKQPGWRDDS